MIFFIFIYFFIMIVSFKNEGRNHYGRIKKIFETSTRLKSWDSRTSRKGKYLKRTRASLQQANPCRYSPWVADGRSSRHGLSLRFADHTGIVQKVENGKVYTVEGNSGDSCRVNEYSIGYYEILGYGAPAY